MKPKKRVKLLHQALVEAQEHFDKLVEEMEFNYYLNRDLQALKTDLVPARMSAAELMENLLHPKPYYSVPP